MWLHIGNHRGIPVKKKKHSKKRDLDSSESDSDSDQDIWSSSTGKQIGKCRKLEKLLGIDLLTTDTCPIQATKLAVDINSANDIAIENSKTGKLTAVVTIKGFWRYN